MSDHRLKGGLSVMYEDFLKWKKAQPHYWVVYWYWRSPCYDAGKYFWWADILPCIGTPKKEKNKIVVISVMGCQSTYNINQCETFDNPQESKKFLEAKRKELRANRDLFNQP